MIPAFNHSYVLPPFEGEHLTRARSSPYEVTATELTHRFAASARRRLILDGLLRYRGELRSLGFVRGFQWLDGSFVEDVEAREDRAPNDVDLVTFAHPPAGMTHAQINEMLSTRSDLFDRERCKKGFLCDAFLVNLTRSPERLVDDARYWYGLYSHRRGDALWKGLLQLPLDSDDDAARLMLDPLLNVGGSDAGTT